MKLAHEYKYGAQTDLPIQDASSLITSGQPLIWGGGADAAGSYTALVDVNAVPVDVFAIAAEGLTTTVTNYQTPLIKTCKVQLVNIVPVWKAYWDDTATSGAVDVSSATTAAITHASGDDDLDGCWVYIVRGTGAGQLRYCKAAAAATKTVNTAFTTAPDNTSDFLLIRGQGRPTGGQDLTATFEKLRSAAAATGQIMILKNWVEGPLGTKNLNITDNSDLEADGLNGRGVRFFSHIIFMDTYFSVDSI